MAEAINENDLFEVLVVEDDADALEEYCEALAALGYYCRRATEGIEALKEIRANPKIGVVLTDVDMPTMDGLTLLGEIQARFATFRPIIPIVITGLATLETAIEAMQTDAIDFLCKPVTAEQLGATMRRASARWTMIHGQFRLISIMELGAPVSGGKEKSETRAPGEPVNPSKEVLKEFARSILKSRQRRREFIDTSNFSEPAWDMLLDLTAAALEGRSVPVLSVSAAANVPLTTALRYVRLLVDSGMAKRWDDPNDKRRSLLALEDETLAGMIKYLTRVWQSMQADVFDWDIVRES